MTNAAPGFATTAGTAAVTTWIAWGLLAVLLVVTEVAAHRPHTRLVPLVGLLAAIRNRTAGRFALLLVWAWFGWHAFAR